MGEAAKSRVALVVDDVTANVDVVRCVLEPFGYSVVWTHDGALALDLARSSPPDLVLCDVHLRGQDGIEVLRALKSDQRLAAIPFIFLSGTVWRGRDRRVGAASGAATFTHRPVDPEALLVQVAQHIHKKVA